MRSFAQVEHERSADVALAKLNTFKDVSPTRERSGTASPASKTKAANRAKSKSARKARKAQR